MIVTPHRSSLVQRYGGAELPATGLWTLHRTSFVGISTRRGAHRLRVSDGALNITEPPQPVGPGHRR